MSPPAPSLDQQNSCDLNGFDQIFLQIFGDLIQQTIAGTRECTDAIFKLSSSYIEKPAFEALKRFYDLYFGTTEIEQSKQRIAEEVGDLVDVLQEKMAAGEDIDHLDVEEKFSQERLGLAGVQKQLEGLITLDAGLKNRILPALTSMQFEDAVNQRLGHIIIAWQKYAEFFRDEGDFGSDMEKLARALAEDCSSVDETEKYFRLVLQEEPPEGQEDRSIFLEF
ncbi:MAG: hypothetical protein ACOH5I_10300 [Oligoflexus sp.]